MNQGSVHENVIFSVGHGLALSRKCPKNYMGKWAHLPVPNTMILHRISDYSASANTVMQASVSHVTTAI